MDAEELARLDLPAEPSSVGRARRLVTGALRDLVDDDVLDSAVVITSELVTNAVLHAGTAFEVAVRRHGTGLRIEVQDASPSLPRRKRYSDESATGRGLVLVEALSSLAGAERNERGKVVWAVLVASAPGPPVVAQAGGRTQADLPGVDGSTSEPPADADLQVAACDTAPGPVGRLRQLVPA